MTPAEMRQHADLLEQAFDGNIEWSAAAPISLVNEETAGQIAKALRNGAAAIDALKLADPFTQIPRDGDDLEKWEAMRTAVTSAIADAAVSR